MATKVTPFYDRQAEVELDYKVEVHSESALANTENCDEVALEETDDRVIKCGDTRNSKLSEIGRDQLITLQKQDPTLAPVRAKVALRAPKEKTGFYLDPGVIQRRCFSTKAGSEPSYVDQLVVPRQCRHQLLELAYDIPLAGHMGIDKTQQRVLAHYFWPNVYEVVATFCSTCPQCQKVDIIPPRLNMSE